MSKAVSVIIYGEIDWHIPAIGGQDYVTACGLDGDDDASGQEMGPAPKRGQKITCGTCRGIFFGIRALKLRAFDFE